MKHRILVMGLVALLLLVLLPIASTDLVDTGIVRAQEGINDLTGTDNEGFSRAPDLTLTLTPYNPPIVIPQSGGSFQYMIEVKNNGLDSVKFDVWTSLTLPDGSTVSPADGPFRSLVNGGWSVSRDDLTQSIPNNEQAGTYTFNAHVGRYPDRILSTESFTFDKLGGGGWYPQSSGTGDWFFDIHFADADNGWAVGQTNEIVHTSNGGDTWTAQSTPLFSNFWSVFAVDAQTAWIGGSLGVIIHTTDGGDTWVQQDPSGTASNEWEGLFFIDANNGWAVGGDPGVFSGSRSAILHTSDGGQNWETQYSMGYESPLNAVYFVDVNNGWAVGGSNVLHTSDGGDTWTPQSAGTGYGYEDVHFINVTDGWAVGRDGTVASTGDGGATWAIQNLGANYDLTGVSFADANNGWISGINQTTQQAVVFHTDDGGATWNNQDPGSELILFDVQFIDANLGWAAGSNGTIISTDSGGE